MDSKKTDGANSAQTCADVAPISTLQQSERGAETLAADVVLGTAWTNPWLARHWQKLVAGLFWLALIGGYTWYAQTNNLGPLESVQRLTEQMQSTAYGPLIYWLVYALRPLIFFPAMLLTIASGFLFGPIFGILLTIVAANTSALVAYRIGHYFGQDLLNTPDSANLLHRYAERMRRNSFKTILLMRFTFLPFDVVNYLAGLLRIDWKAYLLATALGSIPGTFSFVLFGASIESLDGGVPSFNPWALAASVAIFGISWWISHIFRQRDRATRTPRA